MDIYIEQSWADKVNCSGEREASVCVCVCVRGEELFGGDKSRAVRLEKRSLESELRRTIIND